MKSKLKEYLAVLIIVCFIGVIFSLFQNKIPGENNDVMMLLIGAITGIVKDIYSYYFGSSEGSQRKTEILHAEREVTTNASIPAANNQVDLGQ